jgi:hypothetical protein
LGGPSYVGDQPLCEPKEIEVVGKEQVTHNAWPASKKKRKASSWFFFKPETKKEAISFKRA